MSEAVKKQLSPLILWIMGALWAVALWGVTDKFSAIDARFARQDAKISEENQERKEAQADRQNILLILGKLGTDMAYVQRDLERLRKEKEKR